MDSLERRSIGLPELDFSEGDFGKLIAVGFKLGTLQQENLLKPSLLVPGREAVARCQTKEGVLNLPVMILAVIKDTPLDQIPPVLLALDGFLVREPKDYRRIAAEMRRFYLDFTPKTRSRYTIFVHKPLFDQLPPTRKTLFAMLPEKAVAHPDFREIFFPSLLFWTIQSNEQRRDKYLFWLEYLGRYELASVNEIGRAKADYGGNMARLQRHFHQKDEGKMLSWLLVARLNPQMMSLEEQSLYPEMVLLRFEK